MRPTVQMTAERLAELIEQCEADLQLAHETGQKRWATAQSRRWASLDKIKKRMWVPVAVEGQP